MRNCTGKTAIAAAAAAALCCGGCSMSNGAKPAVAASPPPVALDGAWQLAAASGGSCVMNFAGTAAAAGPGAAAAAPPAGPPAQGTIAPEGGCPGNFFTARQWAFEADKLVIRDFRGAGLAQLSYSGGDFQGQDAVLGALTLAKRM